MLEAILLLLSIGSCALLLIGDLLFASHDISQPLAKHVANYQSLGDRNSGKTPPVADIDVSDEVRSALQVGAHPDEEHADGRDQAAVPIGGS